MNPFNLYEAYAAVYDEDLRDELEVIDEDLSFIDDLTDNELTQIMEEILRDGEVSLNECFDAFEGEVITEAESPARARKREAREAERKAQFQKATRPARARGRLAMQRLSQATSRAAENIRSGAESAKAQAGGAISALAGGAAEAGRKGKAAAQRVGGKLAAAKERISGFVKRVGRAAGAGVSAAKAEFSGQAAREAKARDTGRAMRRAARRGARGSGPSPFDEPAGRSTVRGNAGAGRRETASSGGVSSRGGSMGRGPSSTGRALTGAPERKALPAATSAPESARRKAAKAKIAKAVSGSVAQGTRFAAPGGQLASQRAKTGKQEALGRFRKKAGIAEEYLDMILDNILEEIIFEGYATDYDEALYVFEEIGMGDLGELAESYLVEEDFEAWVDGLWEEGYDLSDYTWEGLYEAYVDLYEEERSILDTEARRKNQARAAWSSARKAAEAGDDTERKRQVKRYNAMSFPETRRQELKLHKELGIRKEEVEAYNTIADYLLDEGYAHDLESADAIIASMSEDWIVDILEGFVSPYEGKPSYNDKWGYSPAMRAFRKSEELQKTEPGSKRQKMQTRRSQQLNRVFQAARRA